MGQYRQWLHYRDIDRHLHLQREQLTNEIAHLQEQLHCLETARPDADNNIVQALITQQATQSVQPRAITPPTSVSSVSPEVPLPDWVREEARQYTPNPQTPLPTVSPTYASLPPLPHPIHPQHSQYTQSQNDDVPAPTDPQIAIPHWLRRAASVSQSGPLDPQGVQTNRLVQRWIERWGKQLPEQPEQPYQDPEPHNGTALESSQHTKSINHFTHKDGD